MEMPTEQELAKFKEWMVALRNPEDILEKHASFLMCEIVFYVITLLTLIHALRMGGRYKWLWITIIFHGLTVEAVSYFVPHIDNFWHAQSLVMLLGKRLPLHVLAIYVCFIYTASVAVSRLRLSRWAEPFAVGLAVVLLDVPFDILGIKLLWWTWHDTEPNIADRMYNVPWTSYYFHASFAWTFTFLFHNIRSLFSRKDKFESANFFLELLVAIITGLFSFAGGALQFIVVYHTLHDMHNIHTEVAVLILLSVYLCVTWMADRHPVDSARNKGKQSHWKLDEILLGVILHFAFYIFLVFYETPSKIRAVGLHETIGPCEETTPVTVFGIFGPIHLSKAKYLCASNYDEPYFDFKCVDKQPENGDSWYTVCGTPWPNLVEYKTVVTTLCILGFVIYLQMLAFSGRPHAIKSLAPASPKKSKRE